MLSLTSSLRWRGYLFKVFNSIVSMHLVKGAKRNMKQCKAKPAQWIIKSTIVLDHSTLQDLFHVHLSGHEFHLFLLLHIISNKQTMFL